jgi:hypothetical protein
MTVLGSCALESEKYDSINPTIFPKTERDAEALVTAMYSMFRAGWGGFYCCTDGIHQVKEYSSDIGETPRRIGGEAFFYGRWMVSEIWWLGAMNNQWGWSKYIGAMTLNMDRIEQIDMDADRKAQLIAELRCGRALLTYELYDFYGPLPIPTLEALKNPLAETIFPRASKEDMCKFIEDDLEFAAEVLPPPYAKGDAGYGRFNRGVAKMVQLKFFMLTKQWAKAETAGRKLITYGYDLVPSYRDLFSLAYEKNTETIFSYNSVPGFDAHQWTPLVLPPDHPATDLYGITDPWNTYRVTWRFVHTFDDDDERVGKPDFKDDLAPIVTAYKGKGGKSHSEANDATEGELKYGAIPIKYELKGVKNLYYNPVDWMIFRYADALTLLAEAIVRNAGAVTDEAVQLLNAVRRRAFPKNLKDVKDYDGFAGVDEFYDELLAERARELFWENGSRRQDLIRHDKYIEAMTQKAADRNEPDPMMTTDYYVFPLPQAVITEGKGVIKQNPGYN